MHAELAPVLEARGVARPYDPGVHAAHTGSQYPALASSPPVPELLFYKLCAPLPTLVRDGSAAGQPVNSALFDSGASAGFVAEKWVRKNLALLRDLLRPCDTYVLLGDTMTTKGITKYLDLEVTFRDWAGSAHRGSDRFYLLETGHDMVVGLPLLARNLRPIFDELLDEYAGHPHEYVVQAAALDLAPTHEPTPLVEPWANPPVWAPEDEETPVPVNFGFALNFLEVGYDQAVKDYQGQYTSQVCAEFDKACPQLRALMETKGQHVFVPRNWEGVKHLPPLELEWLPDMPLRISPKARPINPRLMEHAQKEFERLRGYFYEDSNSAIASCLVIAPKGTYPWIRFCGDYVYVNKWCKAGHYPVPNVQHALNKISGFKYRADMDLTNGFHQRVIGPITARRLSLQTPWGQFQPRFLPEGVAPASGHLQQMMEIVFAGMEPWTIIIFDNILVLGHTPEDLYEKLDLFFDRCIEYNVVLKFAKSFIGFPEVKFFGYVCDDRGYYLSEDRVAAVRAMEKPMSRKGLQSFLGSALFFKSFIPSYSELTAPLTDMTHDSFVWNPTAWTAHYEAAFAAVKDAIANSLRLWFPDYSLQWVLRTDASDLGCGAVLLQVVPGVDGAPDIYQPLSFTSHKFSGPATRWDTIEKEGYGIYFGVKSNAYYLYAKPFILETDHANLTYMEQSLVPKIIRWRLYLQSFQMLLRHIKGTLNNVADQLSRCLPLGPAPLALALFRTESLPTHAAISAHANYSDLPSTDELLCMLRLAVNELAEEDARLPATPESLLVQVHGGRSGHHGAKRTYDKLSRMFPGHRIPIRVVEDYVSSCVVCQKTRIGMTSAIEPLVRHIKPPHHRSAIGIDHLTVTPQDSHGNNGIIVVINLFSKQVRLYPVSSKSAACLANCLFAYMVTYGLFDEVHSDPGSDLTSETMQQLETWFGLGHVFSLVNRHESSGVEHSNRTSVDHLRALVYDERILHRWSEPTVLGWVEYAMNSVVNSETGTTGYALTFGNKDAAYLALDERASVADNAVAYMRQLQADMDTVRAVSTDYQRALIATRLAATPTETANEFQPGDFVLRRVQFHAGDQGIVRRNKLQPKFEGPYEVIAVRNNTYTVNHLYRQVNEDVHVTDLKPYFGDKAAAVLAAQIDYDQYEILSIDAWRGCPLRRSSMWFLVRFSDGDLIWKPFDGELSNTAHFERYVGHHPELEPLLHRAQDFDKVKNAYLSANPLTKPPYPRGRIIYFDVRSYETPDALGWYESVGLPNMHMITYRIEATFTGSFETAKTKGKSLTTSLFVPVFDQRIQVDAWWLRCYGRHEALDPTDILLDPQLALAHPLLFDPEDWAKERKRLLKMPVPVAPPRRDAPLFGQLQLSECHLFLSSMALRVAVARQPEHQLK
jgi:hypothetical protein